MSNTNTTTTSPLATAGQALSYLTWLPAPCMVRGTKTGTGQQSLQLVATVVAAAFTALGLVAIFKPTAFQGFANKLHLTSDGMQKFGAIMALLGASGASWSTQNHIQIYHDRRAERKAKEQEGQISDETIQAVKAQIGQEDPDMNLIVSMFEHKAQSENPALSKADASKLINSLQPCLPDAKNVDGTLNEESPVVQAAQGMAQLLEEGKREKVLNKASNLVDAGKGLVSGLLHLGGEDKKAKKTKGHKVEKKRKPDAVVGGEKKSVKGTSKKHRDKVKAN